MRDYELIYVLKSDITDQELGTIRSEIASLVDKYGGNIEKETDWGKRQLAFEINDHTEGIYTYLKVKFDGTNPGKVKEQLKIDERILRYLITRADMIRKPASVKG